MPIIFDNKDLTTKEVFSVNKSSNKILVRFSEKGKEYSYSEDRIKIIDDSDTIERKASTLRIPLYSLKHNCWHCGQKMEIPTYINYEEYLEPLQYPWDKIRLNREKSLFEDILHVCTDARIEYYPISVLGQNPFLDQLLVEQQPLLVKKARMRKRDTNRLLGYFYLAAHCPRCKIVQGWFPSVYSQINKAITKGVELPIIGYVEVSESNVKNEASAGNTVETLWSFIPNL